jgi:RNA polymerase sigma-70 factor, ECF subfamily
MTSNRQTGDETSADREVQYSQFVALIARHDQSIRRFVRSLLPSQEGVDDVVQETALECWRKFSDFAPATPENAVDEFVRWACVIARFKALSWQRDLARDRLIFREGVIEALAAVAMDGLDQQESGRSAAACVERTFSGRINREDCRRNRTKGTTALQSHQRSAKPAP